ncbi:hypothetical protein [Rubrimonas cliftonensis]|uniref:Uncharacterized protein n=1 Tax=Rubrimonas cliftonensis TaxID=89524 RepID=A0A1H3VFY2_9RHOB|nr:hypothetical protein [Rubrimonas cliftonensis]SDZ73640.1 hypothetical protein SAMN05444370_10161 [Rubrimonas cliftonensis]
MTELVFIVCLALSPHQCEERALSFTDVTPMACAIGAQGVLAQWRAGRPGWRVAHWKCGPAGARGMKA